MRPPQLAASFISTPVIILNRHTGEIAQPSTARRPAQKQF